MKLPWSDWRNFLRTAKQQQAFAVLDRRHIYILPTRFGFLFGLILFAMLIGAINFSLSLGFVLVFWLVGMVLIGMLHTWKNLAYLEIRPGKTSPVFAGDTVFFNYLISENRHRNRLAITLGYNQQQAQTKDVMADSTTTFSLALAGKKRGWLKPGRVSLFTEFPLGLFYAWGYLDLDSACLVYPHPAAPGLALPASCVDTQSQGSHTAGGDDDFSELRNYRVGDPMRRVDWKASARGSGMYTKEFEGQGQQTLWLKWEMAGGKDVESRISKLTRWVLDANEGGLTWGLSLPGRKIEPANGEAHLHECLKALALL